MLMCPQPCRSRLSSDRCVCSSGRSTHTSASPANTPLPAFRSERVSSPRPAALIRSPSAVANGPERGRARLLADPRGKVFGQSPRSTTPAVGVQKTLARRRSPLPFWDVECHRERVLSFTMVENLGLYPLIWILVCRFPGAFLSGFGVRVILTS